MRTIIKMMIVRMKKKTWSMTFKKIEYHYLNQAKKNKEWPIVLVMIRLPSKLDNKGNFRKA